MVSLKLAVLLHRELFQVVFHEVCVLPMLLSYHQAVEDIGGLHSPVPQAFGLPPKPLGCVSDYVAELYMDCD